MLMAACAFIGTQHRDVIVFKNFYFHPSTRVFTGYVWTVGKTGEKNLSFSNKNGYVFTGPKMRLSFYLKFSLMEDIYLSLFNL